MNTGTNSPHFICNISNIVGGYLVWWMLQVSNHRHGASSIQNQPAHPKKAISSGHSQGFLKFPGGHVHTMWPKWVNEWLMCLINVKVCVYCCGSMWKLWSFSMEVQEMLGGVFAPNYIFQTVLATWLIKFLQGHCRRLESQIITRLCQCEAWINHQKV